MCYIRNSGKIRKYSLVYPKHETTHFYYTTFFQKNKKQKKKRTSIERSVASQLNFVPYLAVQNRQSVDPDPPAFSFFLEGVVQQHAKQAKHSICGAGFL